MNIHKIHRKNGSHAVGLVVVIDVIRAFTTAAFAFSRGADKIILVKEVEDAFNLHKQNPDWLLMGEAGGGYPIDGFHFTNSPAEIAEHDLKGKTLVQRTSSGTQGVACCSHADKMLISSFVVANGTLKRIRELAPKEVTFVITGETYGGEEDYALADYLEASLLGKNPDANHYLERVLESKSAKFALNNLYDHRCLKKDLDNVVALDCFPFAMEVFKEKGHQVARTVL